MTTAATPLPGAEWLARMLRSVDRDQDHDGHQDRQESRTTTTAAKTTCAHRIHASTHPPTASDAERASHVAGLRAQWAAWWCILHRDALA